MYALKKITVSPDGRHIEEVTVIGDYYQLEFVPASPASDVVARIHFSNGNRLGAESIIVSDEAYITTIAGKTVRQICPGNFKVRKELADSRTAKPGE
ncbi:hypothetical protein EXW94_20330 [Enterobacter sp. JMULE2]|uniref:hypothetical protein n=1 Tax=Enterobacter sp. JMULE2 TaxID=2518340 RepID=UPI00157594CA|nr:hypothetical protein [Enterobacter sp. JMULE2]NTZ40003.1 hypothetical protein [Enterobacter sp. JMULE2]